METIASKDPRAYTANVRKEFRELIEHLRGDVDKVDEPKAQALFETAAEVIVVCTPRSNTTKKRARTSGSDHIVMSERGTPGCRALISAICTRDSLRV